MLGEAQPKYLCLYIDRFLQEYVSLQLVKDLTAQDREVKETELVLNIYITS